MVISADHCSNPVLNKTYIAPALLWRQACIVIKKYESNVHFYAKCANTTNDPQNPLIVGNMNMDQFRYIVKGQSFIMTGDSRFDPSYCISPSEVSPTCWLCVRHIVMVGSCITSAALCV